MNPDNSDDGFLTMPARIVGELEKRREQAAKALRYHHSFLDDCLRGILQNDLVLIGAPSGMGKTDLALSIACSNASGKKRVAYFALEAEPLELERRIKFKLLSLKAHAKETRHPQVDELNYTDWLLAKNEHVVGSWNDWADKCFLTELGALWTFYRGLKFDADDLREKIVSISKIVDLIVIDHLHYVDSKDDETEVTGLGATMKVIRDTALLVGKPVILVAHLRKRDLRMKQLVATLDDFHGSSNIVKICTQAIAIEHAHSVDAPKWWLSPTFMSVLKDRRGSATRLVAVSNFDKRCNAYAKKYTLGRMIKAATEWEPLPLGDQPRWAANHEHMEAS